MTGAEREIARLESEVVRLTGELETSVMRVHNQRKEIYVLTGARDAATAALSTCQVALDDLRAELAARTADAALDKTELSRIRPRRGDTYFHSTVEEWSAQYKQNSQITERIAALEQECDSWRAKAEGRAEMAKKAATKFRVTALMVGNPDREIYRDCADELDRLAKGETDDTL
jgi:chromosome segregation ATPase